MKESLIGEYVRPPSEPTPEWLQRARREGRAEALALMLATSAEEFDGDCDYIGSHPIGATGDYGCHWNVEKLRELFGVREEDGSEIERLEALYWEQVVRIDTLRERLRKAGLSDE